jgi:hypothetical protein
MRPNSASRKGIFVSGLEDPAFKWALPPARTSSLSRTEKFDSPYNPYKPVTLEFSR